MGQKVRPVVISHTSRLEHRLEWVIASFLLHMWCLTTAQERRNCTQRIGEDVVACSTAGRRCPDDVRV